MPESPEKWTTAGMTRRRYPRVKAPLRVRVVELSGKTWVGEAHDLSPLGMKVKAGQVASSSPVHLEFELPGGGPTLNVTSFAVRNDPDGVAFSFVDLTRTAFALIRQAVDLLLLGRKLWILIIEDDRSVADVLADYVEAQGHRPILVPNAEEGLAYLSQDRPDAILLDLTLPGMSGLEFLERLSRQGMHVPVLVVSGRSEKDAARCLEMGALDFVQKPLDRDQLRATLSALEFRSLEQRLAEIELDLGV
ncbi:MAG: response regulator [Candidatus Rokubacteria bacterium]|nr:response regulator [Candidatus Rokubacteria bacterium]